MKHVISGIHHVTAIASDPQRNIDFYTGALGLRLVKLTVNFDDPFTHHLYYGDGRGSPGTILTFFPWPAAGRGSPGTGQVTATAFSVPEGTLDFWAERLAGLKIDVEGPFMRFGEPSIAIPDPDGMKVELVATARSDADKSWKEGTVPGNSAIRGLHHVTLSEEGYERTATLLTVTLGFELLGQEGNRFRYAVGDKAPGAIVDVECAPDRPTGRVAVGSVHHVAWRTPDDPQQQAWRREIASLGYNVSPVMDRNYFHSIYFREPGGILFEIATDSPGFAVDEPLESLGSKLCLPPALEPHRASILARLPSLRLSDFHAARSK
jgi:glyoxalase family protein